MKKLMVCVLSIATLAVAGCASSETSQSTSSTVKPMYESVLDLAADLTEHGVLCVAEDASDGPLKTGHCDLPSGTSTIRADLNVWPSNEIAAGGVERWKQFASGVPSASGRRYAVAKENGLVDLGVNAVAAGQITSAISGRLIRVDT